ncbi:MAG TPA: AMP-binding protein [Holophaga sp.]|jgi:fatty-acyl-CoA synthase|nr:AMP-binding protein [Holophaga sp.]
MSEFIEKTLGGVLEEQARMHPDREFLVYADRDLRWTYKTFNARVDAMAKGLLAMGLKKGDHLGIWATNVPDWFTFFFATAKIGVTAVTVNTNYKLHELEYLVQQSDITTLCLVDGFKDSDYVQMVYELIPELKESLRGQLKSEKFPCLKNLVFMGPQKHRGMFNTAEVLLLGEHMDDAVLEAATVQQDCHDVINMQYTSGTTGFPKGVMLTHYNILNNGFSIGECLKYTGEDRLCLTVPLFHCFGMVLALMAVLTHGAGMVVCENFDPLLALASVQKERCTAIYGVPTMFIAELNHPMFKMFDLSSLRTGIMAGSPCPIEIMRRVVDEMYLRDITSVYGLTEASPGMTQSRADDPLEVKVGTVGRELPGIEVKVWNPETGEDCAIGEPGELCCRGYNVMRGYYKLPEATAEVIDADGWLHSGDLGIKDENGNYRVTGRIKDMIIRGGENIYPKEIEDFLYQMPQIKDVQVAGVPSEKYGEEVGAFVVLKEGESLTGEEVRDYCRGQISRFKIPKYVFFIDAFPITGSGKIQKFKLRQMSLELMEKHGYIRT